MVRPSATDTRVLTVLVLALGALAALALRFFISYHAVFDGDAVAFVETDAWYHMRLVDALVRSFPNRVWFDPYLQHPGGDVTNVGPVFDWLIAGLALIVGAGSPSERLVNQIGAILPAIIGVVTVFPVYIVGRELFSRRAGLWAAVIIGLLPGNILKRSLFGFTDHHCAEVLFSGLAFMFVILAAKSPTSSRRRFGYAALSGISLGTYLLTWSGGALVVAIIVAWATLQIVLLRLRPETGIDVPQVTIPLLLLAGLMVLPWLRVTPYYLYQVLTVGVGVVAIVTTHRIAVFTRNRTQTVFLVWLLGIVVIASILLTWGVGSSAFMLDALRRFSPARSFRMTLAEESEPLMRSADRWPIPLWNQFTTCLLFASGAFALIVADGKQRRSMHGLLFVVWTIGMLFATFGQVRFSYYLAVNVALCAGYACDRITVWLTTPTDVSAPRPVRGRSARIVTSVFLIATIVVPTISRYQEITPAGPSSSWIDALQWLRGHSPDPFGDADVYYASLAARDGRSAAPGMASSYGVLSWWNYGYWIIRIGRRVPIANPRQSGVSDVAAFLLAQDESRSVTIADDLGSRYVIVNWELQPRITEKHEVMAGLLQNMAGALDEGTDRYIRVAYRNTSAGREPVILYEPAYYRTMLSRLYRAGYSGDSRRPAAWVVTLAERQERGSPWWEIVEESPFADYAKAQAVADAAHSPNVRVVGKDPFVSCVPVEQPRGFIRVYQSLLRESDEGRAGPAAIQIFERVKGAS
jgi:dolichyl-diphosphooligosaccharide--protein glycosyltransferase